MRKIPALVGLRIYFQSQLCVITNNETTSIELYVKGRRIRIPYDTQVLTESGIEGKLSQYFSSEDGLFFQFEEDLRMIAIDILSQNREVLNGVLSSILRDCVVQYRKIQDSVVHMSRGDLRLAKGNDLKLGTRIPDSFFSKAEITYMFDRAIALGPKAMPLDRKMSSLLRRNLLIEREWKAFSLEGREIEFLVELGLAPIDVEILLERGLGEADVKSWIGKRESLLEAGAAADMSASSALLKQILRSPTFDENRFKVLWSTGWPISDLAMVYESAVNDKYLESWIDLFQSSRAIKQWVDAGFVRPELAREWMGLGLEPTEASQWYDLDFKNVDEAMEWRQASLSVATCKALRRSGVEEITDAQEWISLCGSIQQFLIIKDDYKISLESLRKLLISTGTVENLLDLLRDGVRVQEIIDWYSPGIDAIDASELGLWIKNGFDSKTALSGHELGISPEVASRLSRCNFTFGDWQSWTALCGSRELVEAAIQNLENREDIEEWLVAEEPISRKLACIRNSLSVSAFKKWNSIGLADEAHIRKWEASGIQPSVAKVWLKGGIHDVFVAKRWGEYGFVASDALGAIASGFLSPAAIRNVADARFDGKGVRTVSVLGSLVTERITAETITRWINSGWRGEGIESFERIAKSDKIFNQWNNSGIALSEWWVWIPISGGKLEVAKAWMDERYSATQVYEFKDKYSIVPENVLKWTKEGFTARDFVRASQGGMTEPSQWKPFAATLNAEKNASISRSSLEDGPKNRSLFGYDKWLSEIRNSAPTANLYRRDFAALLDSAFAKGFKHGLEPVIKLEASGEWYDEIAGRVVLLKGLLRKVPHWPTWYESDQFVVGCAEAGGKVLAWVGQGNIGRVVLFDANSLDPVTKLETQYDLLVYGLAMSWFLDSSLLLDRQIETISLINDVYRPTKNFSTFVSRQRRYSDEIPRAVQVSGHLRLLPRHMNPNHSQRALAPSYLRARMESQHTFVRPHNRNGEALKIELEKHLSRYSATAAAVALIGLV